MAAITDRFSSSYEEARQRFRAATAALPHGALHVRDGLTIDWAWTGDPDARRVLVFSSGLHGVEGFPGSAAQLEMLADPGDEATLWLHVLNPWGMANLRRVDEDNVDLNRNFLPPGQPYAGADPNYAKIDTLLNPPSPPAGDLFLAKVGWAVARHGFGALKEALMSGQHDYPKGLQYAGARLEPGPTALLAFLDGAVPGRERVVHVDLHSGRGKWGGVTVLLDGGSGEAQTARAEAAFGEVKAWRPGDAVSYTIKGGLTAELQRRYASVRYDALTVEFGTYGDLKLLAAFRDENRHHHWGGAALDHPAKRQLVEGFSPASPEWRAGVLEHARRLRRQAAAMLAAD